MYIEFKKIFNEHKDTPLNEKEIIKKTLKVFYNANKEFEEEFEKARSEYNEEIQRREEESDANDMYRTYETLYEPDTSARNCIYNKYFGVIDPQQKFREVNKKIFDLICEEFKKAKEIQINKEKNIKNDLSREKKEEKKNSEKEIENLMISLNQEPPSRKVLIDNINPEFEEVDDE
jgi:alpha-galactosidase/6-phospho-beta-glucosidase family protein